MSVESEEMATMNQTLVYILQELKRIADSLNMITNCIGGGEVSGPAINMVRYTP